MVKPVIEWDGKHLPKGLRRIPPGRYLLQVVSEDLSLSEDEETGVLEAMAQIDAGRGKSLAEVIAVIRSKHRRRR